MVQAILTTTDPKLTKDQLRRDFWAAMPFFTRFSPLRYAYYVHIHDWNDDAKHSLKIVVDYPPLQHPRIIGATSDTIEALNLAIKAKIAKIPEKYENTQIWFPN